LTLKNKASIGNFILQRVPMSCFEGKMPTWNRCFRRVYGAYSGNRLRVQFLHDSLFFAQKTEKNRRNETFRTGLYIEGDVQLANNISNSKPQNVYNQFFCKKGVQMKYKICLQQNEPFVSPDRHAPK
jgi:hypothetical protein